MTLVRVRKFALVTLFVASIGVIAASPAEGSTILLDQQNLVAGGAFNAPVLAQTFTVGISGQLVGVDISSSFTTNTGTLYITGTVAGVPDLNQVLASTAIPPLSSGTLVNGFQPTFLFSPVTVNTGNVLAIVMYIPGAGGGVNNLVLGGAYSGGTAFQGFDGPPILNSFAALNTSLDFAFRTYVDTGSPIATPEPGTMVLFASGLIGSAILHRRARRSARE